MNSYRLCNVDNSCFVIVDIQEKLTAAIPQKVIERLRNNTSVLITAANKLDVPVLTTAQYPRGLGPIEQTITDNLADSAVYFEKTCFSCHGAEGFADKLVQLDRKQIILAGIEAHICVLQSAFELLENGYEVFVVTDAVASRKLTSYESAMVRLNQAGAQIVNTESVLFEWLRDASHADFKELSRLII